jgi:hypothetical protein
MNEIEKRFDAALDLIRWLDARIAQQVEHQLEQRLGQEREYWRCTVADLIVEERDRLVSLVEEEHRKTIDWVKTDYKEVVDLVKWDREHSRKMIAKVAESVDRVFDRLEAKLDAVSGIRRSDDDSQPPPSTH